MNPCLMSLSQLSCFKVMNVIYKVNICQLVTIYEIFLTLADVTSRFDRVFWFGDFNFRVNKKRAEADKVFAKRGFSDQEERKKMIIRVSIVTSLNTCEGRVWVPILRHIWNAMCFDQFANVI